jgi:hypothetical protein
MQAFMRPQGGQFPPQSTSVSAPDFTPSVQDGGGAAHVPCSQMPLVQSGATRHPVPTGHFGHVPPQSTPVSLPFSTPSVQLGSEQCP